jgi:transcriptional regulator with XRE-family HTH domain
MADQERAGARIAVLRKTRGWTARELARRASVSYSLLAKVESGAAPASPALIGAVARALRVDVPRVTGQPYVEPRGQAGRLHDTVNAIRRSIDTYDPVPAVRRGHHYIDLARGYVMAGDNEGSLRCLQAARRIAPQQTRHHPMVRETVLSIASARRGREELSLFASWLGLS